MKKVLSLLLTLILMLSITVPAHAALGSAAASSVAPNSYDDEWGSEWGDEYCSDGNHLDLDIDWSGWWFDYHAYLDDPCSVYWECYECGYYGWEKPTVTSEITKPATFNEEGTKTITATITIDGKEYSYTNTEIIYLDCSDGNHIDLDIDWMSWHEYLFDYDYYPDDPCSVYWECYECGDYGQEKPTVTSKITKPATCNEKGTKTLTATITIGSKEYSDTYTKSIPMKSHSYSVTWTWDGYTSATAVFKCTGCGKTFTKKASVTSKTTKDATCTKTGTKTYTAKVKYNDKTYTNTKTQTIKAKGHKYTQTWKWSGTSSATMTYKCVNGCGFSKSIKTTKITSSVTKATLSKNGAKSYTAKVSYNGKTYSNVKKVTIYRPTKFKLSKTEYIYNGKAQKPTVTVTDANGSKISSSYYTVAYSNNTKVGTATAKITFKGNYTGTKSLTFKIYSKPSPGKPGGLKSSSVTTNSVKLSWNKVSGVTGYTIYKYVSSSKKYVKIGSTTSTSYTIKNLKESTSYKFCVVAYTKKAGETFYGSKSSVLTVKTKAGTGGLKFDLFASATGNPRVACILLDNYSTSSITVTGAYIYNPGYSSLSGTSRITYYTTSDGAYENSKGVVIPPNGSCGLAFENMYGGTWMDSSTVITVYFIYRGESRSARYRVGSGICTYV